MNPVAPASPDERLRRADALVFVDDLDDPELSPADAHHLLEVLRLASGACVATGDGEGRARLCTLVVDSAVGDGGRASRRLKHALLEPGALLEQRPRPPALTVAFALPKGERAEWTVQKLTELGIDRIVPLLSDRTIVRLDEEARQRRVERLARVAREAASQSRRLTLPELAEPTRVEAFVDGFASTTELALCEPGGEPLRRETTVVLVGPEGGWTPDELATVPTRLGLGDTVLRAETAALVAGAQLVAHRQGALVARAVANVMAPLGDGERHDVRDERGD